MAAVGAGIEESFEFSDVDVLVTHPGIVDGELADDGLIAPHERRRVDLARVPQQYAPAGGPQDAGELAAGGPALEPVERLPRDDEIDRLIGEGRRFGGAGDARKARVTRQEPLGGLPHFQVRFNAVDTVAVAQE